MNDEIIYLHGQIERLTQILEHNKSVHESCVSMFQDIRERLEKLDEYLFMPNDYFETEGDGIALITDVGEGCLS